MKKTAKLIAILLTLCTVFALVSVIAFAETAKDQLDASQYGDNIVKVKSVKNGLGADNTGGKFTLTYTKKDGSYDGNYYTVYKSLYDGKTVDEMKTAGMVVSNSTFNGAFCGYPISPVLNPANNSYIMLTLDVAADAADANGKLLYCEGSFIGLFDKIKATYPGSAYFVCDSMGNWYLGNARKYSTSTKVIPISNEVGAWNNITFIISENTIYTFVNGVFLYSGEYTGASVNIDRCVFNISSAQGIYSPFLVCNDNFSINTYGTANNPYVSESGKGLDTYMTSGDYKTKSLSSLPDVVFNSNYDFGTAKNASEYSAVIGGENKTYHDLSALLTDIPSLAVGDTVITDIVIDSYLDGYNFVKSAPNGRLVKYTIIDPEAEISLGNTVEGQFGGVVTAGEALDPGYQSISMTKSSSRYSVISKNAFQGNATNVNNYMYLMTPGGDSTKSYPQSSAYNYVTIDFDLAALEYIYRPDTNGDGVIDENDTDPYTLTASLDGLSDCEKATAKLSYYEKSAFTLLIDGGWKLKHHYVSDENGRWYLSTSETYNSETAAPLKEGVGEYNHVTLVCDFAKDKAYSYVNGEYFTTFAFTSDYIQRLTFVGLANIPYSPCHVSVANTNLRYYETDYKSADNVFGLDDYLALGNPEYPICFADDVNANAYSDSVASLVTVGDFGYANLDAAIKAAASGDTLVYGGDVYLYDYIPGKLETLIFDAKSVSFVENTNASYLHTLDAENKTLNRKNVYFVNWLDESGNVIKNETVEPGNRPLYEYISFDTATKGNYNQALAWEWALADSDEYKNLESIALSEVGDTVNVRPNVTKINWKNGKTENVISESWFVGSTASNNFDGHDALTVLDNGWYEYSYFWTLNDSTVSDFTVGEEEITYVSILGIKEAFKLSSLKINFTLSTRYVINYYVPVPAEDSGISEVGGLCYGNVALSRPGSEDGVYDDLKECAGDPAKIYSAKNLGEVEIGGSKYYKMSGATFSPFTWYPADGFEVTYKVTVGEGEEAETYELSSKVALVRAGSVKDSDKAKSVSYLKTILNRDCGSEEKVLILNWIRYADWTYRVQCKDANTKKLNGGHLSDAKKLYENHIGTKCACNLPSNIYSSIPTADPGLTASFGESFDSTGISANYLMNESRGTLQITIPQSIADKVTVYTTFEGVDPATNKYSETVMQHFNNTKVAVTVDEVECYYFRLPETAAIYNVSALQNIVIEYEGAIVGNIQYSLAQYIYNTNVALNLYTYNQETGTFTRRATAADASEADKAAEFSLEAAMALYDFGKAAFDYKVLTVDEVPAQE